MADLHWGARDVDRMLAELIDAQNDPDEKVSVAEELAFDTCTGCKLPLPQEAFYVRKDRSAKGTKALCRVCRCAWQAAYRDRLNPGRPRRPRHAAP